MRCLTIVATAGAMTLGATSFAQTGRQDDTDTKPAFMSCDTILDAKVVTPSDRERTANIDDLVVDSRNGRALYAIIDTNGILGTDDKTVAIPYGALSWNPGNQQFALDVTADELRNLPECDPTDLLQLQDESWFSTLRGIFGERRELRDAAAMRGDEYTRCFTQTRPESLSGEIVAINRQARTAQGGMCYAVVVEDEDSAAQHTVLLAPVGYLTQESHVPSEGNAVTVTTIKAIDGDGEIVRVAQSIRADRKTLRLRDGKGMPAWHSDERPSRSFCMLASKMNDGALHAQGEEFGSVHDVVFEAHSGTAAYAIISVGGLLGVDDTLYPVPCDAFAMGRENNLYIDTPESKLTLAPKLSDKGVSDMNNPLFAQRVCEFFEVKPKTFDTGRSARWPAQTHTSGN